MDFLSLSANLPFTEPNRTARVLFLMQEYESGSKTRGQKCSSGRGAFFSMLMQYSVVRKNERLQFPGCQEAESFYVLVLTPLLMYLCHCNEEEHFT